VNRERIAAIPAEAGAPGPLAFHHRRAVHETTPVYLADFGLHELQQAFQFVFHHKMIILAKGVGSEFWRFRVFLFFIGEIIERQANNRLCTRHELGRVNAQVEVIFHVSHATVRACVEPFFQTPRFLVEPFGARKPHKLEAQPPGFGSNYLGMTLNSGHAILSRKLTTSTGIKQFFCPGEAIFVAKLSIMKIICLLFLLLPITATFSQNYYPFIQQGVYRDEFWAPELQFCIYLYGSRFWFQGDSAVNGQVYQKLCSAPIQGAPNTVFCPPYTVDTSVCSVFALMREDTAARKVYRYDFEAGVEFLLFDFSAQVGDTVTVGYPPESFIVQDEWYETWGDGSNRRRLNINTLDDSYFTSWIESLGASNNLWDPTSELCICPHGVCYQQNGETLYGGNCAQIVSTGEPKIDFSNLLITPNPATQNIVVQIFEKERNLDQVVISDMLGKVVARQETAGNQSSFEINVGHLPAAVYSVSVFANGRNAGTKRFQKI